MTDVSPKPKWFLNKKTILVSASDLGTFCTTGLRIGYDETNKTGSVSLRIMADLANLSGKSQVLLNISPEIVEECTFESPSDVSLCSHHLIRSHPANITEISQVSTLSLKLSQPGMVLYPSEISETEFLSPAKQGDLVFDAFAKICRSQDLRLHIAHRQYKNNERDQLASFSKILKGLQLETFENADRVEKTWRVFLDPSLNPPKYCEERVTELVRPVSPPPYDQKQEVGKRGRGISHLIFVVRNLPVNCSFIL